MTGTLALRGKAIGENRRGFRLETALLIAAVLLYVFAVVRSAWLCDDSYITFRTVDNLVNGYGLTWNTDERVQTYTHPLWMFVVALFYAATREIYYTVILISALTSIAAMVLLVFRVSRGHREAFIAVVVLTLSKAFVDYSTSGLENPLTFLLLAAFMAVYSSWDGDIRGLFLMSLLACLGALNRMDTLLLFAPALVYSFFKKPTVQRLLTAVTGFLPFPFWEVFSLLYYGFLFPNTAHAKLDTGISVVALAKQGFWYFVNSIHMDPLTLLVIAATIGLTIVKRESALFPVIAGVVLYLLYVLSIGGDFMTGRFFAAPLFAAATALSRIRLKSTRVVLICSAFVLAIGFLSPYPTLAVGWDYGEYRGGIRDPHGVGDERRYYYHVSGLLKHLVRPSEYHFATASRVGREKTFSVSVNAIAGFPCFTAGPNVHIIDPLALGDPLLARLPAVYQKIWQIGDFTRIVPEGYVQTIETGVNQIRDRNLAAYYDKLALVTRGDIWDPKRLVEIVKINLGKYDHFIDRRSYRKDPYDHGYEVQAAELWSPKPDGTPWDNAGNMVLSHRGIRVRYENVQREGLLSVGLDSGDFYQLTYYLDDRRLGQSTVRPLATRSGGLASHVVQVPSQALSEGYDSIVIKPLDGDEQFSIGYLIPLKRAEPAMLVAWVDLARVQTPRTGGLGSGTAELATFPAQGLDVVLSGSFSSQDRIETSLSGGVKYSLLFLRSGYETAAAEVNLLSKSREYLSVCMLDTPVGAREMGVDTIRIVPEASEGQFVLGHLILLESDMIVAQKRDPDFPILDLSLPQLGQVKKLGIPWDAPGNTILSDRGVRITLDAIRRNEVIEASLDNGDEYEFVYFRSGKWLASQTVSVPPAARSGGLVALQLHVPKEAYEVGYDQINVFPLRGDGHYSLGHLRLLDQ